MKKINYGFVLITGTKYKGRFGRYVKYDEEKNKAKVLFGYEGDENKYLLSNSIDINLENLTSNFNLKDLLDRYYEISNDLKKIYLWTHPTIRPRSQEHQSISSEYNLIHMLIDKSSTIYTLDEKEKNTNVFISYDFRDLEYAYDLMENFEIDKYHIATMSHEYMGIVPLKIDEIINKCKAVILLCSNHSLTSLWLKKEIKLFRDAYADDKRVIVLALDGTQVHSKLIKYVLSRYDTKTYNQLLASIEDLT